MNSLPLGWHSSSRSLFFLSILLVVLEGFLHSRRRKRRKIGSESEGEEVVMVEVHRLSSLCHKAVYRHRMCVSSKGTV